jgi:hypothetical protein
VNATNKHSVVLKNTASTRGPSAKIARRSQLIISRKSIAGMTCAMSVFCAAWMSPSMCHRPDTDSAVTVR